MDPREQPGNLFGGVTRETIPPNPAGPLAVPFPKKGGPGFPGGRKLHPKESAPNLKGENRPWGQRKLNRGANSAPLPGGGQRIQMELKVILSLRPQFPTVPSRNWPELPRFGTNGDRRPKWTGCPGAFVTEDNPPSGPMTLDHHALPAGEPSFPFGPRAGETVDAHHGWG